MLKFIKIITTSSNEYNLPNFLFNDSEILKKYFEDYDILDLSEYDDKIIIFFFEYLSYNYNFSNEIVEINCIETLIKLFKFCDKFNFNKIYKSLYYNNNTIIKKNILIFLDIINPDIFSDKYIKLTKEDKIFKFIFYDDFYLVMHYLNFIESDNNKILLLKKLENYLINNEMNARFIGYDNNFYFFEINLHKKTLNEIINKIEHCNNKIYIYNEDSYNNNITNRYLENIILHNKTIDEISNNYYNLNYDEMRPDFYTGDDSEKLFVSSLYNEGCMMNTLKKIKELFAKTDIKK